MSARKLYIQKGKKVNVQSRVYLGELKLSWKTTVGDNTNIYKQYKIEEYGLKKIHVLLRDI